MMKQSTTFELDKKYTFDYFFHYWMKKNDIKMDYLISACQLNSYTAGISESRVYKLTRGIAKPDPDEMHLLLSIIGIPYNEYESFMRLRGYYLRIAAGEKPEEIGDPPS